MDSWIPFCHGNIMKYFNISFENDSDSRASIEHCFLFQGFLLRFLRIEVTRHIHGHLDNKT